MQKLEAIKAKERLEHELAKLERQHRHLQRQLLSKKRKEQALAPVTSAGRWMGWGQQTVEASMMGWLEHIRKVQQREQLEGLEQCKR